MSATKEQYSTLFDAIIDLEEDKKEISLDIKERVERFASQYGLNKEAVKLNLKLYKMRLKDEANYHEVTGDTGAFMDVLEATAGEA